eukprot:m.1318831 g.1318831  ORF g.1318831 m.1318831 type:complete len:162 (-) comp24842_c0_seq6:1452-1937(-)
MPPFNKNNRNKLQKETLWWTSGLAHRASTSTTRAFAAHMCQSLHFFCATTCGTSEASRAMVSDEGHDQRRVADKKEQAATPDLQERRLAFELEPVGSVQPQRLRPEPRSAKHHRTRRGHAGAEEFQWQKAQEPEEILRRTHLVECNKDQRLNQPAERQIPK